ncbi:MAG: MYG1 family protein [Syntrophotaleaceae bacterium]
MQKIVVHPGNAHRDDFLSVCVLLATCGDAAVFRCQPTEEDLADPETFVIDVGMEYDPEKHNFDHHHDRTLPCAFHLIMQHLGYHEDAMQVYGWYPIMNMMDVDGPHKTAEDLGVDPGFLLASSSPIDGYVLSRFSLVSSLGKRDLIYKFMKEMGKALIGLIDQKKQRLELLKKEARVVEVKQFRAIVSTISEEPKLSMELFFRHLADPGIVMCITPSVRCRGWELLRLGNSSIVDFRTIANHPGIDFVHANGYVATTRNLLPFVEIVELASEAVRDT